MTSARKSCFREGGTPVPGPKGEEEQGQKCRGDRRAACTRREPRAPSKLEAGGLRTTVQTDPAWLGPRQVREQMDGFSPERIRKCRRNGKRQTLWRQRKRETSKFKIRPCGSLVPEKWRPLAPLVLHHRPRCHVAGRALRPRVLLWAEMCSPKIHMLKSRSHSPSECNHVWKKRSLKR